MAASTAVLVISLKATRLTSMPLSARRSSRTFWTCQLIASPSRSGSGEDQLLGAPQRLGDRLDLLLGTRIGLPQHGEVVLGVDRSVIRRQIPDVTVAGEKLIVVHQLLVDRLCLGG